MKCPGCHTEHRPGRRFCTECGAALPAACPKCGVANEPGDKFCGGCGTALAAATPAAATAPASRFGAPESYTPEHLATKILASRSALEGERKQVTVLFADVKGSMELLADRDPEDARAILDPVLALMMDAVHEYDGTVNQVMGDGIMALFGAPVALEEHAVRAALAALKMQDSIARHAQTVPGADVVRIRVGLNSGEVVVRAIGTDLKMDYSAVGQTTHLAARMEQTAPPGTILMTADTMRLAAGYVRVRPLGPMSVKGLPAPLDVYELVGTGGTRTRLQLSAARGFTRLVGRQVEMDVLPRALAAAGAGRGQVVAFVGDAGVGKSRLFWEFAHSDAARGWLVLEARSVSYGKATTYLPIIDLLKAYFQIEDGDDVHGIGDKVRSKLTALDPALGTEITPVLALLNVLVDDGQWASLEPARRRQRTLEAIQRVLLRQSQASPLLLIFEDLHWIDSETQALLDGLIQRLQAARILLLVNYRPEYRHHWSATPTYTQVRIEPLPPQSAADLLGTLVGDDTALAPLKEMLIERTRGNPFFLEESVRMLVETDALAGERGAYRLTRPLTSIRVPPTVEAILAARIDRLPLELKSLLQAAAVIGKDVPLALLQRVADLADAELRLGLDHLQAVELLYETSLFPQPEYSFQHALTHDVAYAGLLHDKRRALDARIVEAVEQLYATRRSEYVERLAHHAYRGQIWDKAVTYLRQAGLKAQGRSAHREALTFLEQALEALGHLPEGPQTRERAIDVRLELRGSLYPVGEFEKMLTYLKEAEALAAALGDTRRLGLVSLHTGEYFRQRGRFAEARALAEQALAIGDELRDSPLHLYASHYLALACHALGDYRRGSQLLRSITQSAVTEWPSGGFAGTVIASWDAFQSINLAWLARCLAERGEFEEGVAAGRQAVAVAEEIDSPYTLCAACIGLGYICLVQGDIDTAIAVLEHARAIARDANLALFRPQATRLLGGAHVLAGRIDEGLAQIREAASEVESKRLLMQHAAVVTLLGEGSLAAGLIDEAAAAADRAVTLARERGQRGDEAAALRVLADVLSRDESRGDSAVRHYADAMALAEELQMWPLLARSHLGLGRLHLRRGDRAGAADALLRATGLFGEMKMRFWLDDTAAALKDLGDVLIVAADRRDLYEYLRGTLGAGSIPVVLDRRRSAPATPPAQERRKPSRLPAMLASHSLSIA